MGTKNCLVTHSVVTVQQFLYSVPIPVKSTVLCTNFGTKAKHKNMLIKKRDGQKAIHLTITIFIYLKSIFFYYTRIDINSY